MLACWPRRTVCGPRRGRRTLSLGRAALGLVAWPPKPLSMRRGDKLSQPTRLSRKGCARSRSFGTSLRVLRALTWSTSTSAVAPVGPLWAHCCHRAQRASGTTVPHAWHAHECPRRWEGRHPRGGIHRRRAICKQQLTCVCVCVSYAKLVATVASCRAVLVVDDFGIAIGGARAELLKQVLDACLTLARLISQGIGRSLAREKEAIVWVGSAPCPPHRAGMQGQASQ